MTLSNLDDNDRRRTGRLTRPAREPAEEIVDVFEKHVEW
jgi:hypothetical protein